MRAIFACLLLMLTNEILFADIATTGSASVIVDQVAQRVTITSAGTCTVTATAGVHSADVDRITVSGSGIGNVTLTIAAARDIGYIDLTGSTGTLSGLSITGTIGVINATNTQVSAISGTISTGGRTDRLISAASASSATFSIGGDCKGISIGSGSVSSLTVAGDLLGNVSIPSVGALTISGSGPHTGDIAITGAGPHSGTVTITNDYSGDMTLTGDRSGEVKINGDLTSTGSVTITGEMSGHLVIGDAPNSPVAGRFSGLNQKDLAGTVTLGTAASPPQEFTGGIDVTGELTGTLSRAAPAAQRPWPAGRVHCAPAGRPRPRGAGAARDRARERSGAPGWFFHQVRTRNGVRMR